MNPPIHQRLGGDLMLTPEQEELLHKCFKHRITRRNEMLLPKCAVARHMYFVVKG